MPSPLRLAYGSGIPIHLRPPSERCLTVLPRCRSSIRRGRPALLCCQHRRFLHPSADPLRLRSAYRAYRWYAQKEMRPIRSACFNQRGINDPWSVAAENCTANRI